MSVQPVDSMTPYSTAEPMFGSAPGFLTPEDAARIQSYQVYEQMYWGVPDTFKLTMRGSDTSPIYVPTARTIIDTTNRYLAVDFTYQIDTEYGTDSDKDNFKLALDAFFKRERFYSKFSSNKRFGLIRGDWCWHVRANPLKPQGSRLSIEPLDPASYFPVTKPDDPDKIIAVHIIEVIDVDGEQLVKRQTYTRGSDPLMNDGSDTTIWSSEALFALDAWEDLTVNPVTRLVEPFQLDPRITAIPVYHIKNLETPGDPFGSSDLRGFERIMAAVNQVVSDAELILAVEGLGMYATDGGPPVDEAGNETDTWGLGPGRVVELPANTKMWRINANQDMTSMFKHAEMLADWIWEGSSTPSVARGSISVEIAESGIALFLRMSPMLAKIAEREIGINGTMTQMLFDLKAWHQVFEAVDFGEAIALPYSEDPMPIDRAARVKEILSIVEAKLASPEWGRLELSKLGYDFDSDEGNAVLDTVTALAEAEDSLTARTLTDNAAASTPDPLLPPL